MVHLWIVHAGKSVENGPPDKRGLVSHVKGLEGHTAPINCLGFYESASLLASGCMAGSVRIWDLKASTCNRQWRKYMLFVYASYCTTLVWFSNMYYAYARHML